jgi:hypothetical protein
MTDGGHVAEESASAARHRGQRRLKTRAGRKNELFGASRGLHGDIVYLS